MILIALLTSGDDLVSALVQLLEVRDWDLLRCPPSPAAFDHLVRERPDLIIFDHPLALSGPGRGLMRRLQADPQLRRVPTLVVVDSSHNDIDQQWLLKQGFAGVCDALDWDDLGEKIEEVVSARERSESKSASADSMLVR